MKKLMIAAAIVCAAALSQAATFKWTCTGVTDSPTATASAGWVVYYMAASTFDTAVEKAAEVGFGTWAAENKKYQQETFATTGRGAGIQANASTGLGSYGLDDKESGYLIIFNNADAEKADYYAMTTVRDSNAVTSSGNDITTSFGEFSTATDGWKEVTVIPEPTSGLLLLLGVAGLALRRRRA